MNFSITCNYQPFSNSVVPVNTRESCRQLYVGHYPVSQISSNHDNKRIHSTIIQSLIPNSTHSGSWKGDFHQSPFPLLGRLVIISYNPFHIILLYYIAFIKSPSSTSTPLSASNTPTVQNFSIAFWFLLGSFAHTSVSFARFRWFGRPHLWSPSVSFGFMIITLLSEMFSIEKFRLIFLFCWSSLLLLVLNFIYFILILSPPPRGYRGILLTARVAI